MEHQTLHPGILALIFVIGSLLIGAFTRSILKKTMIPYTVGLLGIGLILGFGEREGFYYEGFSFFSDTVNIISDMDPNLILFVFLPILIFESAFGMEVHLFKRLFSQIVVLAIPGLVIATCITAVFVKFIFPWGWDWPTCLLFGSLISATDPVAVVALLKEVSSRKRLETLIEGESLLNNGTAMVLFALFYTMMINGSNYEFDLIQIGYDFTVNILSGILIGLIIGWGALYWIGKIFNDPMVEITVTVGVAYLSFVMAESVFHVSGVVAVVTVAVYFAGPGRTKISPEVEGFLHHFWEMMAFLANTVIFLLVGIVIANKVTLNSSEYWIMLVILYFGITIIRAITVIGFTPILQKISIGFNRQKAVVLIWGGLQGAVALALALAVAQDTLIEYSIGDQILFLCAGIVVLTMFINGSTLAAVLKMVGLDKLPPAKEASLTKAKAKIANSVLKVYPSLKENEFLHHADWKKVASNLNLEILYVDNKEIEKRQEAENIFVSLDDLAISCRRRLLEIERQSYWSQFNEGVLGKTATMKLVEVVEIALDGDPTITPRPELYKMWHISKILRRMSMWPIIRSKILRLSFNKLYLGYNIARGFIHAQHEMENTLVAIAPSENTFIEISKEIKSNIDFTYEHIDALRTTFPEILQVLETQAATIILLNKERKVVHDLIDSGVLEASEAKKMLSSIEEKMIFYKKPPKIINLLNARDALRQVPWLSNCRTIVLKKIAGISKNHIYYTKDIIMDDKIRSSKVVILIRGIVQAINKDNQEEIIKILLPGSVLGDIKGDTTENAIYVAKIPVEVLIFNKNKFRKLVGRISKEGKENGVI